MHFVLRNKVHQSLVVSDQTVIDNTDLSSHGRLILGRSPETWLRGCSAESQPLIMQRHIHIYYDHVDGKKFFPDINNICIQ